MLKHNCISALPRLKSNILTTILLFVVTLYQTGCGQTIKVKGETQHYASVSGEAKTTNEFVFKIDVSGCQALEGANQATCITETVKALGDLVKMVKEFACKDEACKEPTDDSP